MRCDPDAAAFRLARNSRHHPSEKSISPVALTFRGSVRLWSKYYGSSLMYARNLLTETVSNGTGLVALHTDAEKDP
jgi:hypothetical protein